MYASIIQREEYLKKKKFKRERVKFQLTKEIFPTRAEKSETAFL